MGLAVGSGVGLIVGIALGFILGAGLGDAVGTRVGTVVGLKVGIGVGFGEIVGNIVGAKVFVDIPVIYTNNKMKVKIKFKYDYYRIHKYIQFITWTLFIFIEHPALFAYSIKLFVKSATWLLIASSALSASYLHVT